MILIKKKLFFYLVMFSFFLIMPSVGFSENIEVNSEASYSMADWESPLTSEKQVFLRAKIKAVEVLFDSLKVYLDDNGYFITEEEIIILSWSLMEVKIIERSRNLFEDQIDFYIKIKVNLDTESIDEKINIITGRNVLKGYQEIYSKYQNILTEIKQLNERLSITEGAEFERNLENLLFKEEKEFLAHILIERGYKFYTEKEYRRAINIYSKAISLNSTLVDAYYYRGKSFSEEGLYEDAIKDYGIIISIDKNSTEAHLRRAFALEKLKRYEEAIKEYNWILTLDSENTNIYLKRGYAYKEIGEYEKSILDFNTVIKMDSENFEVYYKRSLSYGKAGNLDKMVEDYNYAVSLNPEKSVLYYKCMLRLWNCEL